MSEGIAVRETTFQAYLSAIIRSVHYHNEMFDLDTPRWEFKIIKDDDPPFEDNWPAVSFIYKLPDFETALRMTEELSLRLKGARYLQKKRDKGSQLVCYYI